jgi:predicted dehydrogenase
MRLIQVGVGGMGGAWMQAIDRSPHTELAAIVDIDPEIAAQQAARYNLNPECIFASLPEALAVIPRHEIDGVVNVTPPQFHRQISSMALEHGIPVLSEKPLAASLRDALGIVRQADRTGVLLMVAQNYRYTQPAQTLKQVLDSGEMGAVGSVTVDFFKGPHFGGFREEMDYPLIIDMAIHHFDMMRFFLDSDPAWVFGRSWNPPWSWFRGDACASVLLGFQNGITTTYNGSWCSNGRETTWNADWRFECEHGVVTLENDQVYVQRLLGVQGFDNLYAPPESVTRANMPRTGQDYLLYEFYEAVMQGGVCGTPCQDNIKSLAIVFDVVQSCETGAVIKTDQGIPKET